MQTGRFAGAQRTGKGENTGENRRRRRSLARMAAADRGGFSCLSLPRSWLPLPPRATRFLLPIAEEALAGKPKFRNANLACSVSENHSRRRVLVKQRLTFRPAVGKVLIYDRTRRLVHVVVSLFLYCDLGVS